MNKNSLIIIGAFLLALFQIPGVKENFLNLVNGVKENIVSLSNYISISYEKYILNTKKIDFLEMENKILKEKLQKIESRLNLCKDLNYFKKLNFPNLTFSQTISYAHLPDMSQIYIDYNKKILFPKGLVYNNLAAGIVIKNFGNYSLALLNSNPKTTYTVFIGKKEIPGIFYGKINIIKYIPRFKEIKKGDIVITSGLDGVFYKGAKVGIITKVIEKKLYQEASIKLFYNSQTPTFFYVIDKKHIKINKNN
jgi:rod shape-determining protein MreC